MNLKIFKITPTLQIIINSYHIGRATVQFVNKDLYKVDASIDVYKRSIHINGIEQGLEDSISLLCLIKRNEDQIFDVFEDESLAQPYMELRQSGV